MKRLLVSLSVALLLGMGIPPASAQSDDFEKEFQAFKKKIDASKETEAQDGDGLGDEELGATEAATEGAPLPRKEGSPLLKADTSPLGPAGRLPLNKPMPATARTMALPTAEETQAQIEAEAAEQKKKFEAAAFEEALQMLLPLKPDQIRKTLGTFKDSREASETPVAMPKPRVVVETVSLDPSVMPPVIKTSPGRVTTITILDQTGSPWPIQDASWAGKFEMTPPEEGGHVVRVTPQSAHGVGNLSIRLVDLITPITFTLQTGLEEVDYRFDARIPKQGPLAKTPLIEYGGLKTVTGTDENLVQILDGTPPGSSEKLKIEGVDGRTNVWRVSGNIYLRTPLTLLSPAWNSSVTSADGMNVYVLSDTPVILLSDEGRMVHAHIAAAEVTP